jgi:hypothetical protein
MKDSAIMLLKTHIEKMSVFGLAIISMKIIGLSCACHYVYEKTRGYRKFKGNGLNCMSLRKKELSRSGGRGVEKRGVDI